MTHDQSAPELLPLLSAGRHRSPRRGACFMEMASYLAGERWSDHPACTHPLLATLARHVNDRTADADRSRLALLVPSVVGLHSDDPRVDARLALLAALRALPVADASRQRVMAVAVLGCDRVLAVLDGRDAGALEPATRDALEAVPAATAWALRFSGGITTSTRAFRRATAPHVVSQAVEAIAATGRPDVDERLHDLLAEGIAVVAAAAPAPAEVPARAERWDDVVRLTGAAPRA